MPAKQSLLIAALVVLVSAVVWLVAHRPQHTAQPPAIASSPPSAKTAAATVIPATPATLVTPTPAPSPATTPGTPEPGEAERAATARMFAAHAPLRVPEVADPDSAINRRILQTMVTKALVHSAPPAAALAPSK